MTNKYNMTSLPTIVANAGLGNDTQAVLIEMKRYMTIMEIAAFFGVTRNKIISYLYQYNLRASKVNKTVVNDDNVPFFTCDSCKVPKPRDLMRTKTDCKKCALNRVRARA